jgi:hypothetical protein
MLEESPIMLENPSLDCVFGRLSEDAESNEDGRR